MSCDENGALYICTTGLKKRRVEDGDGMEVYTYRSHIVHCGKCYFPFCWYYSNFYVCESIEQSVELNVALKKENYAATIYELLITNLCS